MAIRSAFSRARPGGPRLRIAAAALFACLLLPGCLTTEADYFDPLSERFVLHSIRRTWFFFAAHDGRDHLYRVSPSGKRRYLGSVGSCLGPGISPDGQSVVFCHRPRSAQLLGPGSKLLPGGIYVSGPEGPRRLLVPGRKLQKGYARTFPVPPHVVCFQYVRRLDSNQTWMTASPSGEIVPLVLLGGTRLHAAAYQGSPIGRDSPGLDRAVLDQLNHWRFTALELAVMWNRHGLVRELLELGADPSPGRSGAFLQAVRFGRSELLELVHRDGDITAPDRASGRTPLLVALQVEFGFLGEPDNGFTDCGTRADFWGRECPFPAADADRARTVAWLLSRGADPNAAGKSGVSPLLAGTDFAGVEAGYEIIRGLLEHGADVLVVDPKGRTARQLIDSQIAGSLEWLARYGDAREWPKEYFLSNRDREDMLRRLEAMPKRLLQLRAVYSLLLEWERRAGGPAGASNAP